MPAPSILDLDVPIAVARIADGQLKHARKALARLRDPGDRTALHKFRVSVRRLDSQLRAYRPWIGRAGARKPRRLLKDLIRTTGLSRDAEVQIEWLEAQRHDLERGQRPGLNWLLRRSRASKRSHDRTVKKRLGNEFERLEQGLRKRLGRVEESDSKVFRAAFIEVLEERAGRFSERLAGIANADDHEGIHESRIAAKRLRYVVEPVRALLPEARAVIQEMKRVQDLLGQLHDKRVLEHALRAAVKEAAAGKARRLHALAVSGDKRALAAELRRDEQPGLAELTIRARRERDALFDTLSRQWIHGRRPALAMLVENLRRLNLALAAAQATH